MIRGPLRQARDIFLSPLFSIQRNIFPSFFRALVIPKRDSFCPNNPAAVANEIKKGSFNVKKRKKKIE